MGQGGFLPGNDNTISILDLDRELISTTFHGHWYQASLRAKGPLLLFDETCDLYDLATPADLNDPNLEERLNESRAYLLATAKPEIPRPRPITQCGFDMVKPITDLGDAPKAFLMQFLACIIAEYNVEIAMFKNEWEPDSFPFRELTFALISIASGNASWGSFSSSGVCLLSRCRALLDGQQCGCCVTHLQKSEGWISKAMYDGEAAIPRFGSMSHLPGHLPGASPADVMYWHENVLVGLAKIADGAAIDEAVSWGIHQGRTNFQVVVISLSDVIFAELVSVNSPKPFIRVSEAVKLSPLSPKAIPGTTRRNNGKKPCFDFERFAHHCCCKSVDSSGSLTKASSLERRFPGLAALVNFFDVAARRRAAARSTGVFPPELYDIILGFVDYDTWKNCLLVSPDFRSICLANYKISNDASLFGGPQQDYPEDWSDPDSVSEHERTHGKIEFCIEDRHTGKRSWGTMRCRDIKGPLYWMPVIGSGPRKAMMVDLALGFQPYDADWPPKGRYDASSDYELDEETDEEEYEDMYDDGEYDESEER